MKELDRDDKNLIWLECDHCHDTVEELYEVDDEEWCEDCVLKSFKKITAEDAYEELIREEEERERRAREWDESLKIDRYIEEMKEARYS